MTNKNEQQLDDPQLSSIYKQAKQEMPPAHLDKTILTAAKQQTAARPMNPFTNNWRMPASLAAVLIISFGIVTLMETDVTPVNGIEPAFDEIDEAVQSKQEQTTLRKAAPKRFAKAPEVADREMATTIMPAKQKSNERKRQLSRTMEDSGSIALSAAAPLMATPTNIPSIKSIRALRLAGNQALANQQANIFIRHYFGNELNKIDPAKVILSTKDWKDIISELRQLDRESIATKLEKLLEKRLTN